MTALEHCVGELIMSGAIDWVSSSEVAGIAAEEGGAAVGYANRALSLTMIREVLLRGLMHVGELDPVRRDFRMWKSSPEESLLRIAREWPADGPLPGSGDICWLRNTSEGDRQAELIAARKPR